MNRRGIGNCILLAVGYFALACLGRMLALPPGYASPVWPAAGLALGGLLLCGNRCWPGLWLGSLAFNVWVQASSNFGVSVAATCIVATGATLQALLGAVRTRRFLEMPAPLSHRGDAFLFLWWGAPVACLISSSLSIPGLYLMGRLPEQGLFAQWLAWWAGDTIGVLLLAPLVFVLHPRVRTESHLQSGHIWVPLLLVATLIVVALVWLDRIEVDAANQAQWRMEQQEKDFAGRVWQIEGAQAGENWQSGMSIRAQLLHAGSVVISFWVVLIVLASAGYAAAIAAEVAERRRAEQSLRNSEMRLQAILDNTPALISTKDLSGTVTMVNRQFSVLDLGAPESFVGRNIYDLFPFEVADRLWKNDLAALEASEPVIAEEQVKHKDGSEHTYLTVKFPLRDADGKPNETCAISTDITDRKRAEQALRDSEAMLEETGNLANVGGWQIDVMTGALRWTQSLFRMTDSSPDLPLARGVGMSFVAESHRKLMQEAMETLSSTGQAFDLDVPFVSSKGRKGWVHIAGRADWKDGVIVRLHGAVQDITERLMIERQANHSQRLQAIGTLAGGIAHDLNNALLPIILLMDVLKEEFPERQDNLLLIERSAQHAADMVRQLLMFAKGAEGTKVALQPNSLLQELKNLLQAIFPRHLTLVFNLPHQLPAIYADATQLHQVLLNLCVNARDAMPEGGCLTVAALCKRVEKAPPGVLMDVTPGDYLAISVQDTGAGIAPELQDRIFDPFFTTKAPDKGTGLGLSAVMGIVRSHGGFVQLESELAKGSCFTVYLPLQSQALKAARIESAVSPFNGNGRCVLLLDDEEPVRVMGAAVLQKLGCDVLAVADGESALQCLRECGDKVQAVITDIHMPGMDGLVFVRNLRELLPDVPVIVSSGFLDEENVAGFRSMGVTLRMDKPFTRHGVAAVLAAALDGEEPPGQLPR